MIVLQIALAMLMIQSAARVEGVVTRTGTSEPVSKAIVELRNDSDNVVQYTVATGDDGQFAFRDIRSGKYRLVASHSGFVRMEYGQRKTGGRGLPIDVNSAQRVAGLQLSLMPTGAIHGRIHGPDGQPIIKASVRAMKTSYQNGQRILTPVQTTLTNDLGEYRLFWLPPGQYFVGAYAPNWSALGDPVTLNSSATTLSSPVNGLRFGSPVPDPLAPLRTQAANPAASAVYLPVYFPNTTDNQAAQSIDVKPGSDLSGIDIMLSPLKTRRVRGTVIARETGQPPAPTPGFATSIRISPRTDGGSDIVNSNSGTFDIQVGLGTTVLSVAAITQTGSILVPAGDTDLEDVRIVVSSGLKLPGQVFIDGVDPSTNDPRLTSLRVTLRGDPQIFTLNPPPPSGVPSRDGAFTIGNVTPGNYRLNISPILNLAAAPALPPGLQNAYVKSVRMGETNVLSDGLQIGTEQPDHPLAIVVGLNPGSISGIARTEQQMPASDVTVVLVPDAAQRLRTDLYRSTVTDASGRYTLDRIPPGAYKLFAWDDVDNGAWQDAQFIRAFEDLGKPVMVTEGSKDDITLTVIPPK